MKIVTLSKEEFDDFSRRNKYNSFYQTSNYAEFKAKYEQFSIHYLGFRDNNNRLIGASLMLYKTLFWGYKYAYAPRGLLIDYDNDKLIDAVTEELKKLLRKQKFIFITIDPPVIASERDRTGNTIQFNNNVNRTLGAFKRNGYEHLGFNLYDESILPRWNVVAPLAPDARIIYNSFDNEIKEKLNYANNACVTARIDNTCDIKKFYDTIKKKYTKKNYKYFENLTNAFMPDKIKIFYAYLDTKKYTENANNLYIKEEERNNNLASIIQSGDQITYNIPKAVEDKITSDKLLHTYKKDVVSSAKFLKANPEGIILGAAITIEEANGVSILLNYADSDYESYNTSYVLTYEIMKYFGKENFKYLNLGSVTGNFNPTSKYYPLLLNKVGFNSSILEYIGQFNIIINPTIYLIYKKKYNK